jgi:SAM-dependent methyltransferase
MQHERIAVPAPSPTVDENRWKAAARILGRMTLGEKLCLALAHEPAERFVGKGYPIPTTGHEGRDPLRGLRKALPEIDRMIAGQTVLDVGCGDGHQTMALAKAGARSVTGLDIVPARIAHAEHLLASTPNATATLEVGDERFDIVVSNDAFEHFDDPAGMLAKMRDWMKPGGRMVLSFGPLWRSPYGAHLHFMTPVPWCHFIWSERTLYRVRQLYRDDGTMTHAPGLNFLGYGAFLRLVRAAGLSFETLRPQVIKGQNWLAAIPVIREPFVAGVACVLRRG